MACHAVRPFRVTFHTKNGVVAPSRVMMATNPKEAIIEALSSLRQTVADSIDHIEVTEGARHAA